MRIGRDALCTVDDFIQPSFFAGGGARRQGPLVVRAMCYIVQPDWFFLLTV